MFQVQILLLLLLCCCSAPSAGQQAASTKRLVCYYTSWARYRNPLAPFTPQNINPHLCTHLHYAIANTNSEQKVGPADPSSDFTKKGYEQIVALKKVNPALKVLIMLGGSNSPQQMSFEEIVTDDAKMERFVTEVIKYVRRHNFDGVDIDWKVSGHKAGHAKLLETLSDAFRKETAVSGKEMLLLSTTTPSNATKLVEDFDIRRIADSVDYINALMYQFHSGDQNVTGHHAPLFTTDPEDTEFADFIVQMYIDSGADPAKLNLAVPTFGKTFTLSDPEVCGFGAAVTDVGFAGKLTKARGTLSFTEICEHVSMDGWVANRPHPDSVGPYAVKGDQWVAYDDEFMMRRKGAYVREKGLGGAAVWSLSQDDFRGFCTGRQFPLIEALKMGLFEDGQVTTTTPSPPTTPQYDNTAVFACQANGRFPKPDNCAEFYICTDGLAEAKKCENGTNFDAKEGFCNQNAVCVDTEVPRVTEFEPTPAPATPARPIPPILAPLTSPPVTPAPVTPVSVQPPPGAAVPQPTPMVPLPISAMVPPPLTRTSDAVVIPAAAPAPRQSEMKLDMGMEVKNDGQLQQVLRLIQELGGVESVRSLLAAVGKPERTAATAPQPGVAQVVTTNEGKTKIRVHVTVEVEPF